MRKLRNGFYQLVSVALLAPFLMWFFIVFYTLPLNKQRDMRRWLKNLSNL